MTDDTKITEKSKVPYAERELIQRAIGTNADNTEDKMKKGRYRNGRENQELCKRGHLLSGDNLKIDKRGFRRCKACDAIKKIEKYRAMTEKEREGYLRKNKERRAIKRMQAKPQEQRNAA